MGQMFSAIIFNTQQAIFVELAEGKSKISFAIEITLILKFILWEITESVLWNY